VNPEIVWGTGIMKIGIVSPYFYPWYGGITEHVFYLYKGLKCRGHTVRLITPFNGRNMIEDREDLITIGKPITLILNGSVVKVPLLLNGKKVVESILEREQFDIIHLHQPLFCILGLTFLGRIRQKHNNGIAHPRVVGTFHACGGGSERFFIKKFGFFFKKYKNQFDYRIAVSQASRDFIHPVFPGEYTIIPNGVDIARFSNEHRKIDKFNDGVFNILFVGRLEPRKGLTNLLKSIPYINKFTSKPFRLLVVGNGMFSRYYKSKIPAQSAENVFFLGDISINDLPVYYNTAHVFCSPATYGESFGIVLIEAMAAGLPIIAGDIEGYRKVITDGENGVLVNPENPLKIAQAIGQLLESDLQRKTLSEKSRLAATKFSWDKIVNEIDGVYQQLLY
jgi:phosphatidyl-myo-inositol alpha-mannosyltransferase